MRIYTRTGDKGETSLFNGARVSKDDRRIELLGNLDELSAFIGILTSSVTDSTQLKLLKEIQSTLLSIGAEIANPKTGETDYKNYSDLVEVLEKEMDNMDRELPPLKNFILPGGSVVSGYTHVCRTITRRCERLFTSLTKDIPLNPTIQEFLNRLSDYFFVLARFLNKLEGCKDSIWEG